MFWRRENPSKTEWTMFLIITILLMIIIFYFGNDFLMESVFLSQDKRLFDAISFSGTVVSIILGLLAIIYTLFQGFSSQSSSDKLAIQLESLEKVVTESGLQQQSLGSSIAKLVKIESDIDNLANHLGRYSEENKTGMYKISEEISRLQSAKNNSPASSMVIKGRTYPSALAWTTLEAFSILLFVARKNQCIGTVNLATRNLERILRCQSFSERSYGVAGVFYSLALMMEWVEDKSGGKRFKDEVFKDVFRIEFIRESVDFAEYKTDEREFIEGEIEKVLNAVK